MTEFFIHIEKSKITNPQVFRKNLEGLKDGRYSVKIERKNKRSTNQNAYIHGVLFPEVMNGLREAGFDEVKTPEDAKVVCKSLFLKRNLVNKETGEVIEFIKDTHELTTVEMGEFIEDVIRWGSEYLNYQIPYPNEKITLNFLDNGH